MSLLPESWSGVPEKFHQRLGSKVGRQRLMSWEGHHLLVLHEAPTPEETSREGRFFWRNPEGVWRSSHDGEGIESLAIHLNHFAQKLEQYDKSEAQARLAQEYYAIVDALTPLHRSIRHLHQVLQDARQACPEERELIALRDRAYVMERTAELLYAGTKNNLELLIAQRAEEQARSSHNMAVSAHRLNILAAFFFPISILATVFGVSYKEVLEGKVSLPVFGGVLAVGVLCGVILTTLLIRKPSPPKK